MSINNFSVELALFLPEIFLITSTTVLLLWSLFVTTSPNINCGKSTQNLLVLLIINLGLTVLLLTLNINKKKAIFYDNVLIDNYSTILKILILICTIIFLTISSKSINKNFSTEFEFPILIVFSIFAIMVLLSANDLITFYLSIELQSLCLYVLAAFKKDSQFSSEAGLKYFVLGAFSSSIILFGMSLIYGFSGSTNFDEISKIVTCTTNSQLELPYTLQLGLVFLICGFLFKLTAVPFHVWSPDVYEGSPMVTTIYFSTIPKLAIFGLFAKVLFTTFFNLHYIWQPLLNNVAGLTIVFASLAALYQKKVKRFLAYSSISHVGYMLIGLSTGTITGLHAFFLYILIYLITMFTFFGLFISLQKTKNKTLIYLTDLLFLNNVNPLTKLALIVSLFSMASIPPLMGFFAKFYILFAAVETNQYFLVALAVLCSTLSAFYYIRIIKIINFEKIENLNYQRTQQSTLTLFYVGLGILFVSFFVISPNFLVLKTYQLAMLLS
jgi:NADH-quinone oxidoreductase subunit N